MELEAWPGGGLQLMVHQTEGNKWASKKWYCTCPRIVRGNQLLTKPRTNQKIKENDLKIEGNLHECISDFWTGGSFESTEAIERILKRDSDLSLTMITKSLKCKVSAC